MQRVLRSGLRLLQAPCLPVGIGVCSPLLRPPGISNIQPRFFSAGRSRARLGGSFLPSTRGFASQAHSDDSLAGVLPENVVSTPYFHSLTVKGDFATVLAKTRDKFVNEAGFSLTGEEDMKKKFVMKGIDAEFPSMTILSGCQPLLAYNVVKADPHAATFLPCTIIVRELGENECEIMMKAMEYMSEASGKPGIREALHAAIEQAAPVFSGWD